MRPELLEKQERSVLIVRFLRGALLRQVVKTRTGPSDEDHPISLPATASAVDISLGDLRSSLPRKVLYHSC